MENLIILGTTPVRSATDIQIMIFTVFIFISLAMGLAYVLTNSPCDKILCFLLIGTIVSFFSLLYKPKIVNYQYDVLVDENINIQELYNTYNIVSVKGNIYTIELKERLK